MSVFLIAEAGVNHNGHFPTARALVDAAKEAGADAVKFQHFNSHRLWGDARIEHLQLTDGQMESLAAYCAKVGIEFMATPFGIREVGVLAPIVRRMKVASGCLERWGLLEAIALARKPVILSTGMADISRISGAVGALMPNEITLLHCTSAYPAPIAQVNLAAMDALRRAFNLPVGYSDHTAGIIIAIAAVARGAQVIEKHLTLARQQIGPDHKASIEPTEFRIMAEVIRTVEKALGDGIKRPQPSETKVMEAWYGN